MTTTKALFKIIISAVILINLLATGCSRMETPNFQQLILPSTPNFYLACPKDYCNVKSDIYTPVYAVSAESLFNLFNYIIAQEPRTSFVYSIPEQGQYGLTALSQVFPFPDDIAVQFIALSESQSTIAIFSKTRYGYYDFGVNKKRVERWLNKLAAAAAAQKNQS